MPKNFDDVILPERRKSIRNIPIPEGRRKADRTVKVDSVKKRAPQPVAPEEDYQTPPPRQPIPRHRRGSRKRFLMTAGAVLLVAVFAGLSMFGGATLSYIPRSALLAFENEIHTAHKTGSDGLLYSIVKLSGDKGLSVSTSGEEEVTRKASGTIIVYNNASAEPQRLIENTRFESPSGKIYRIQSAITIPGRKIVEGETQPGSIEAVVYADLPGPDYNSGLTDFTVPGLKGTPRYSTIYARSKTPMTGGFTGTEKVVSANDLSQGKAELQSALSEELLAKAQAEVPADFILLPALSALNFEDLPQSPSSEGGSKATINMRGHLYGIMFKRSDLARELSKRKISIATGEVVDIESFENLQVTFAGSPPADLLPLNEINLRVSGSATVVWKTDEVALKSDLAGRNKKDISTILNNYPTIASATAKIRPFWSGAFPEQVEKITIKKLSSE